MTRMMHPHAKPGRNRTIVALVKSGMPVADVAEKYGITRQRVYQLLPEDLQLPGREHLRSPLRAQAHALRDLGFSQQAIADELGVSRAVARKYLSDYVHPDDRDPEG